MRKIKYFLQGVAVRISNSRLAGTPCENMSFERFLKADRVVITSNPNKRIRTIKDLVEIHNLAEFALSHRSGWHTPWIDTPIALINANFYQGKVFLGDLGVGSNFLTAQGCGYFQCLNVSPDDRTTIMKLFAVKDPYENDK